VPEYDVLRPGWKYNMLDLQAALGICQLRKLDRFNALRRERAERYARLLEDLQEVRPLGFVPHEAVHAWHLYVVRLELEKLTLGRSELMGALGELRIGTGLHFPPLHLATYYRRKYGYVHGSLPCAERAGERIISLPLYPLLTEEDQHDVAAALRRVIEENRRKM
jgi:dTDP-4-amino-4,6-dideoxygalactose transaminase